ncbi:MAG: hypothetical protein ABTR54_07900 [Candidatus Competibacter sp.]
MRQTHGQPTLERPARKQKLHELASGFGLLLGEGSESARHTP